MYDAQICKHSRIYGRSDTHADLHPFISLPTSTAHNVVDDDDNDENRGRRGLGMLYYNSVCLPNETACVFAKVHNLCISGFLTHATNCNVVAVVDKQLYTLLCSRSEPCACVLEMRLRICGKHKTVVWRAVVYNYRRQSSPRWLSVWLYVWDAVCVISERTTTMFRVRTIKCI